jgi:hypothetical protein
MALFFPETHSSRRAGVRGPVQCKLKPLFTFSSPLKDPLRANRISQFFMEGEFPAFYGALLSSSEELFRKTHTCSFY